MKILPLLIATFCTANLIAQSSADFTFKALRQLGEEKEKKSIFISPYSIRTILSLCAEGAEGKTLSEMLEALSLPTDANQRRREMQSVLDKLGQAKSFELLSTNTIWIDKSIRLLQSYSKIAQNHYQSVVKVLGFSQDPEKARNTINNFVAEKTKQMIKNLIPSGLINRQTRLVLTNTIYFKADWEKSFDKKNTQMKDFWLRESEKKSVKMMYQKNRFSAGSYAGNKVIALPYKGDEAKMWVILPENKDLSSLVKKIDASMWQKLKAAAQNQEVLLTLPLFEFETKYRMKEYLEAMGMGTAFSEMASFPNISQKVGLKISEVIHQAKIKVEEKGTEAAAATAVIMELKSSMMKSEMPPPPFIFTADHPFLFLIEHTASQEILFAGTMLDPSAK
ncbi:MAG: serpin family protein [Raineya sp.]